MVKPRQVGGAFGSGHKPAMELPQSQTTGGAALPPLDNLTRLKLVRDILDKTVHSVGAGYVLVMFLPGSDQVLRSFAGIDTRAECKAVMEDVGVLLAKHAAMLPPDLTPPSPSPGPVNG